MNVIKTIKLDKEYNLTIISYYRGEYEIQFTNSDYIFAWMGAFRKREALNTFNKLVKLYAHYNKIFKKEYAFELFKKEVW